MSAKWQGFLIGLFAGIFLSGTLVLILAESQSYHHLVYSTVVSGQDQISSIETASSNEDRMNINTATIDELSNLPGIGPAKAKAIVDFREKYRLFESIEELLYVPGLGESLYQSLKDVIFVEFP
jgi:competence protein ComEA